MIDSRVSSAAEPSPASFPGTSFLGVLPTRVEGAESETLKSPASQIRGWESGYSSAWLQLSLATFPDHTHLSPPEAVPRAVTATGSQDLPLSLTVTLGCEPQSSVCGAGLREG